MTEVFVAKKKPMSRHKIFMLIVASIFFSTIATSQTFYIGPTGGATGDGTRFDPLDFQTAINKASTLLKADNVAVGGIKIIALGGTYPFETPFILGSEFKGTATKPIVIEADEGALVEFDGSLSILSTSFDFVTDAADKARLSAGSADKILVTSVTDARLKSKLKTKLLIKLNFDGKDYFPSTFPNTGKAEFAREPMVNAISPPSVPRDKAFVSGLRSGEPPYVEPGKSAGWKGSLDEPRGPIARFKQDYPMGGTWQQWEDELKRDNKRNLLEGFFEANWLFSNMPIVKAIASEKAIHLSEALRYGWLSSKVKQFNIYGLICEVDAPGEWYFDTNTNKLYVYPITPGKINDAFLPSATGFLVLNNAEYVQIKRINAKNLIGGNIININGGSNNLIAGCKVYNSTATGIRVTGSNNIVEGCDLVDLTNHLGLAGGTRNSSQIIEANNIIRNCHFYQKNYISNKINIRISGVGNIFRNNLIHNSIGQALVVSGNGHLIELNEAFNIGFEEGDGGAFYSGGNLIDYGTVFKNNFIHHIIHSPGKHERAGIFMDDQQAGSIMIGNVFYKSGHSALKYHTGAGHEARDNIFLEGRYGIHQIGSSRSQINYDIEQEIKSDPNHPKIDQKENYVGRAEKTIGKKGWESAVWKTKYPLMFTVMSDEGQYGRLWQIRNTYVDNHHYNNNRNTTQFSGVHPTAFAKNTISDGRNLSINDFVDYGNMNFEFKPTVTAVPNIPFKDIGLYQDEYRCEMPVKESYRKEVQNFFDGIRSWEGTTRQINTGKLLEEGPKTSICSENNLPSHNIKIAVTGITCPNKKNGSIEIEVIAEFSYSAVLNGKDLNGNDISDESKEFTKNVLFSNLSVGDYEICITVAEKEGFEQCYNFIIREPESLSVTGEKNEGSKKFTLDLKGGDNYEIELNNKTIFTKKSQITLDLSEGENNLTVKTDKLCQGVYNKQIMIVSSKELNLYPMPVIDDLNISLGNTSSELIKIIVCDMVGQTVKKVTSRPVSGIVTINLSNIPSGLYFVKINGLNVNKNVKIIKK